jgi:hypothetical protein
VLVGKATPGEWMVQDGCSWRRIGTRFHDGDVLCPMAHRDGCPDLIAADGRRDDNLALIVALVNAAPALLDTAERVGRLEEALGQACAHLEHAGAWVSAKVFRALLTDPTTNIHNAAQSGGE